MIRLFLNTETERRQTFWTFALVSLVSLFCVQALYFLPVAWVALLMCVQTMNVRVLVASVLGLLMPYWFALAYVAYTDNYPLIANHFSELIHIGAVADFSTVTLWQWGILLFIIVLSLVAVIYYYRHNYYERHLYKMVFNAYVVLMVSALVLFIVLPYLYWLCIGVIVINVTPFITRYFSKLWKS